MKRDMDLVRLILQQVENADAPVDVEELGADGYSLDEVFYHVELMRVHGLLDATLQYAYNGERKVPFRGTVDALTWDGCDYLDAIRDDRVWKKTKKAIKETIGSTTVDAIKEIAVKVGTQLVLMSIGGC